ncbi:copper chaperone PCu(A)C [Leucobacter sp. cx-42]|uniref:copper chaperone PCu(A)C n=1 Tax=unclassified Leucobacter TaxID=2621730 RepID=UPI00165D988D|nr:MULTISPECIES: copper chaperone PCu(A)C [unclassified Leucobacter]MBC9954277.1 copper chaperone PCu(A)C [Leucobacter sp. cx-42]
MNKFQTRTARVSVVIGAALLALTGCSSTGTDAGSNTKQEAAAKTQADAVKLHDFWLKASDKGMTGAFGTIENTSGEELQIVSAKSPLSDDVELHETVADGSGNNVMQEVQDGYKIPAHGKFELAPGANHIMLMDLKQAVPAGDDVEFTLVFSDGSEHTFNAMVKDYAGAKENYRDEDGTTSHDDMEMDHSSMEH